MESKKRKTYDHDFHPSPAVEFLAAPSFREFMVTKDGVSFCALCGNTGVIERIDLKGPIGQHLGTTRNYCICPNGRCLKEAGGKLK